MTWLPVKLTFSVAGKHATELLAAQSRAILPPASSLPETVTVELAFDSSAMGVSTAEVTPSLVASSTFSLKVPAFAPFAPATPMTTLYGFVVALSVTFSVAPGLPLPVLYEASHDTADCTFGATCVKSVAPIE